jgi:UDP-GlcNAc:undecaprenyl-phosphate GlcNAc-1-phosphate transferase
LRFPLNVYLLSVVTGCIATALALPFWRRWCIRIGLVDEPGQRKIHAEAVPLAGGLAIITGILIPILLAGIALWWANRGSANVPPAQGGPAPPLFDSDTAYLLGYGLRRRAAELMGILVGAVGMLVVGFLDDKHELRPGAKFLAQVLVAFLVAASGARITLFVPNVVFHYAVTMLWILTVINAFNFMDNMNGLCAGLSAIGAACFGVIAGYEGQYLVALIAFLTLGAILGFLPYNFPRARAFLGDTGSHLLGYLLAVLAILPHFYNVRHPRKGAVLTPLLVLAVPLLDLVRVVLIRWRLGRPFYIGDTNHLSHWLVSRGLSRPTAVILIWFLAVVAGALGLWLSIGLAT